MIMLPGWGWPETHRRLAAEMASRDKKTGGLVATYKRAARRLHMGCTWRGLRYKIFGTTGSKRSPDTKQQHATRDTRMAQNAVWTAERAIATIGFRA